MASDEIEVQYEAADGTVSFRCCAAVDPLTVQVDAPGDVCSVCGAEYAAYTDVTVYLYRDGNVVGEA